MASLVIGIDGGASNTVALLAEAASGRVLGRGSGGPSNIQAVGEEAALRELNHAVSAAFKAAGLPRKSVAAAALARASSARLRYSFARLGMNLSGILLGALVPQFVRRG